MREALQKTRQDLGGDALILSTRQLRRVGIPFLRRQLWEVAAVRPEEGGVGESRGVGRFDMEREAVGLAEGSAAKEKEGVVEGANGRAGGGASGEGANGRAGGGASGEGSGQEGAGQEGAGQEGAGQEGAGQEGSSGGTSFGGRGDGGGSARVVEVSDQVVRSGMAERDSVLRGLCSEVHQLKQLLKVVKEEEGLGGHAMRQLHHELTDMRQAVQALQGGGLKVGLDLPETLMGLQQHLVVHGLEEKFAKRLVEQAAKRLPPEKREDFTYVKIFLARMLTSLVKTTGGLSGEKVLVLVGCTGVGKTTTVAKLASEQVLRYKRKTALITVDTFRIGALEQLKAYAKIMNLPLSVVRDRTDLHRALEEFQSYDVVLVDTAGRSQSDLPQMKELKGMFQNNPQLDICLVLSATTKDAELIDTTRKFGCLPLKSVLFTKLDECMHCGSLFNHFIRFKLPINYLTTGQRVPEDMEIATPERLIDLLLQISSEA